MYEHKFWQMDKTQLFELFNSSEKGLSPKEIIDKREFYGLNEISKGKTKNGLKILISQFKNPLVILLIIASIIALLLGETITGLVIIIIVLINGFLGFFQEYKSERTIEKLKKYVVIRSRVVRDGKEQIINSSELVPGDLIHLKFGDVIPADIRIVESSDLTIDESSLTGEFFPVEKDIDLIQAEIPSIHDLKNMSFMGTHIREGEALGIIVTTGKNTYFGKTAQLLKEIKRESEFQKKMKDLSFYLVKLVLATIIIIFFINMLISKDFVKILLFSLALAVGMVPEALSIIITISLSNGAVKLAKKDVIVKRLISVEDLGNIDIICTDKTGTLTENLLTLEDYFDLNG
ncbi:MAG: HAD-IC family P-type ATPase [Candidatus Lokiarchaeota archaeon]|nr:HAD-IC family P-type ATPase [Candidatus Lokiarchaeota archaeon]